MRTAGDPEAWRQFLMDMTPCIIASVVTAWETFPKPRRTEKEVPITARLLPHVRDANRKDNSPFNVWLESTEIDAETGQIMGRLDLRFVPRGADETIYFALECKRLNVVSKSGKRSLAREYVVDGMMRFVDGKYGANLNAGGMLGYVMDGKTTNAIKVVDKKIASEATPLRLLAPKRLSPSDAKPNDDTVRQTTHQFDKRRFTMQHVFLTV